MFPYVTFSVRRDLLEQFSIEINSFVKHRCNFDKNPQTEHNSFYRIECSGDETCREFIYTYKKCAHRIDIS